MKLFFTVFLAAITFAGVANAQDTLKVVLTETDSLHHKKIFVVSGSGWGFTMGRTGEVLKPRYSGNMGLDISLKDHKYFLYPSLDFLTFGYDQQEHDNDYPYDLQNGRSNFYTLNLAIGIRKQLSKLNAYAFAGPGASVVSQPRSIVLEEDKQVRITNKLSMTPTFKIGAGADYKLGRSFLFLELGWSHNFIKIQDRSVNVLAVFGGVKTDVTRIADTVAKVVGVEGGVTGDAKP